MRNIVTVGLLAACLFTLGCSPLRGVLYSNVTETGTVDQGAFPSTTGGRPMVTYNLEDGMGAGSKSGEVTVENWLYLVAFGDASLEGAAAAGGINKIHTVSTAYKNYFFVYSTWTTRVTGE